MLFFTNFIATSCVLVVGFMSLNLKAQSCSSDAFYNDCASNLDKALFIKAFEIQSKNFKKGETTVEYNYVFSKGTTYVITSCDKEENPMIIELLDRNQKLIASNYDKEKKKFYPKIAYPCSATGVYYLKYKFKNSQESCGVSMLGFTK